MSEQRPIVGIFYALLVALAEEQPEVRRGLAGSQDHTWPKELTRQLAIPARIQIARLLAAIEHDAPTHPGMAEQRLLAGEPLGPLEKQAKRMSDRLGKSMSHGDGASRFKKPPIEAFIRSRETLISDATKTWLRENQMAATPTFDEKAEWQQRAAELLLAIAQTGSTVGAHRSSGVLLPTSGQPSEEPGGADYEEVEASCLCTFRRRTPAFSLFRRTVLLREGRPSSEIDITFNLPNQLGEDVCHLETLLNCKVIDRTLSGVTGYYNYKLRIPTPDPGQPTTFCYAIRVDGEVEDQPFLRHTVRAPGTRFQFDVQFDEGCWPVELHSFRTDDVGLSPERLPNLQQISLSEYGGATATFMHYRPPEYFGLVFGW